MQILIIGGSDAGISAALRVQELDPSAAITIVLADAFPNFSICGLPFFLSGETLDWRQLAHRTEFPKIEILREHRATHIDTASRTVLVEHLGVSKPITYDKLIIGTGAVPAEPPIEGLRQPGVFLLHTMENSFRVHERLHKENPQSALIVGAGYIGLEMADALIHRGLKVTLASRPKTVLPTVEPEFGKIVEAELSSRGVEVWTGVEIASIERNEKRLKAHSTKGQTCDADLVIVATGVRPSSELAKAAGLEIGDRDAIRVNRLMETSAPNVFAAGDCVETWHRLLGRYTYLPLGSTSHKQGRVAGENAVGGKRSFAGILGTQVVKVFDLVVARTGLLESEARAAGFNPFTTQLKMPDDKAYYPGSQEIQIRVTGDRTTGKLMGAQILGRWKSEVSKRVDVFAAALFHEMTVEDFSDFDLSYTPPLSSPWDPVQMATQSWSRESRLVGIARQPS
jgi:NADPH-dependent 2,4-dienoyl-CoA reductase/sulfur reductase-like enzyme